MEKEQLIREKAALEGKLTDLNKTNNDNMAKYRQQEEDAIKAKEVASKNLITTQEDQKAKAIENNLKQEQNKTIEEMSKMKD
jgi:hypothetical protein